MLAINFKSSHPFITNITVAIFVAVQECDASKA